MILDCILEVEIGVSETLDKKTIFSAHVLNRIERYSNQMLEEMDYNLKKVKKRVMYSEGLSYERKAREIDRFAKITTGVALTSLGFLSTLISDINSLGGS